MSLSTNKNYPLKPEITLWSIISTDKSITFTFISTNNANGFIYIGLLDIF